MTTPTTKQTPRGKETTPATEAAPSLESSSFSRGAVADTESTLRALSPAPRSELLEVPRATTASRASQRLPDGRQVTDDLDPRTLPVQKMGAKGEWVKLAQERLNAAGAELKADGVFGRKTVDAVKRFQAGEKLAQTGLVDTATWAELLGTPVKNAVVPVAASQPAPTKALELATHPYMRDLLKLHEDLRHVRYQCSEGHWTIGVGHNLEVKGREQELRAFAKQRATDQQIDKWLSEDISLAYSNLEKRFGHEAWFKNLSINRKIALTDMSFNLGNRLFQFEETIELLRAGKFKAASAEALDSRWAKQVGDRAKRIATILATDTLPDIEADLKAKKLR